MSIAYIQLFACNVFTFCTFLYAYKTFKTIKQRDDEKEHPLEQENSNLRLKLRKMSDEMSALSVQAYNTYCVLLEWRSAFMTHKKLHLGLTPEQIGSQLMDDYQQKLNADDAVAKSCRQLTEAKA